MWDLVEKKQNAGPWHFIDAQPAGGLSVNFAAVVVVIAATPVKNSGYRIQLWYQKAISTLSGFNGGGKHFGIFQVSQLFANDGWRGGRGAKAFFATANRSHESPGNCGAACWHSRVLPMGYPDAGLQSGAVV